MVKIDGESLFPFLQGTATIALGAYVGGAVYVNVVEHSARMELDTKSCHKQWKASFDRAKIFQSELAIISGASAIGAYFCKPSKGLTFLLGGCAMAMMFPYTLFVLKPASIDPIYDEYDKIVERESEEFVRDTIVKWNKYHAVRSVISLGVFVEFVAQMLCETQFFG